MEQALGSSGACLLAFASLLPDAFLRAAWCSVPSPTHPLVRSHLHAGSATHRLKEAVILNGPKQSFMAIIYLLDPEVMKNYID